MTAQVGGWTLGLIGLFNIIGAMTSGWLGSRMPKRYILSCIYFSRALAVIGARHAAGDPDRGAGLWRGHRPAVAVLGAADLRRWWR